MKIIHGLSEYETSDAFFNTVAAPRFHWISRLLFGSTVHGDFGRTYRVYKGKIYLTALS